MEGGISQIETRDWLYCCVMPEAAKYFRFYIHERRLKTNLTDSMEQEVLFEKPTIAYLMKKFLAFMEPAVQLLCSQEPAEALCNVLQYAVLRRGIISPTPHRSPSVRKKLK
jgi:hypothetical protein